MSNKKGKPKQELQQQQSNDPDQQEQRRAYPRETQNRPSFNSELGETRSKQQIDSDNPSIVRSEN